MHGLIFQKLQDFVVSTSSGEAWLELKREAGFEDIIFSPTESYPDEYIEKFVEAAQARFELKRNDILEAFGNHMGPQLMKLFSFSIDPSWKALDVILHTEEYIHKALKMSDSNINTPELVVTRTSETELKLIYSSPRNMIALGVGIIKAIGSYFGETLKIEIENENKMSTTLLISKT